MIGVGRASGGLADQRGDQPAAGDEDTSQPERGGGWRSVDLAAMDPVADRPFWLALSQLPGIGPVGFGRLLAGVFSRSGGLAATTHAVA